MIKIVSIVDGTSLKETVFEPELVKDKKVWSVKCVSGHDENIDFSKSCLSVEFEFEDQAQDYYKQLTTPAVYHLNDGDLYFERQIIE